MSTIELLPQILEAPPSTAAARAMLRVLSLLHIRPPSSSSLYYALKDGMVSVVHDQPKGQQSGLFTPNVPLKDALEFLGEEPDR